MTQSRLFETDYETELLDIHRASEMLGVSTATIRNWVKTGHLSYSTRPDGTGRLLGRDQVERLKSAITDGETSRLTNRANKRHARSTFIPVEQLDSKSHLPIVQSYVDLITKQGFPTQAALLVHSLTVLRRANLVDYGEPPTSFTDVSFKNENVRKVVLGWDDELGNIDLARFQPLVATDRVLSADSLGVLYQSLLNEGMRSQGGSYYTPRVLINNIVEDLASGIGPDTKVLDPCCGTGQFLVNFSKHVSNPLLLWGYDIDPLAVQISRVNLLTSYPQVDFYPNVFVGDSLRESPDHMFDIVATNPPWGYHFSKDETAALKETYPGINSNEAFSYFLVRGLNFLNEDGLLCYVLPEAITKVKQHRDVREFLLRSGSIRRIRHLGNVFSKVLSPVITLSIQKREDKQNEVEVVRRDRTKSKIRQTRFQSNPDYTFDTSITEEDEQVVAKIYSSCVATLKDNADWALGIVTGNNSEFISSVRSDVNEGILKGSDIERYTFRPATSFITFTPDEFQQVAPTWKYRAKEKLIYKFISSELAFAYDDRQTLTLNSANILLPKIPGIPAKVALVFLNSYLFQYLYKKKFNTIKVLRGDLEQLPFPQLTDELIGEIGRHVDRLLASPNDSRAEAEARLNELVFDSFGLTTEEKRYICNR